MKPLGILLTAWIGYLAGKCSWRVRPVLVVATVGLAAIAHASVRGVLPHNAIERFATAAPSSALFMPVAALETVGIWLPLLVVPWGVLRTRAVVASYVVVAATLGALAYYEPFDVVIMNGEILGPKHPYYEASLMFSLVFASLPFAISLAIRWQRLRPAQPNKPPQPTSGEQAG